MRVVIVGAGIAGLWIAEQFAKAGHQVIVLEKYNYLGGRIVTSKYGYEIGAGRIHPSHRRVHALLRRFGLHTVPIPDRTLWRAVGSTESEPNVFDAVWTAVCAQIAQLEPTVLATHTLRQLTEQLLGAVSAARLLERFPYRAETETLRADMGLLSFQAEMGSHRGYTVVREGLSSMIAGLEKALVRQGVEIRRETEVVNVTRETTYRVHIKDAEPLIADRVVLALHATALRKLPVLRGFEPLRHLRMEPLNRIYAAYPEPWFGRIPTITNSPLRYIIPVSERVVMISYTEGPDTATWHRLKGPALQAAIQKEVRRLFPERSIPEPEWVRPNEWQDGCTYWLPGSYDPVAMSRIAFQPRPATMPRLHICGESFSVGRQAWMEGALEHAEALWSFQASE